MISTPIPWHLLQQLAAPDERRQHHLGERRVLEQELAELIAVDGDVPHRLGGDRGQEHGLARE